MRFTTVLFDLDGTLIDSRAMILSSFRHATKTVLDRDYSEEELLAHVGGTSIYDQMRRFDAARAEELVRVYSEHNAGLHAELEAFPGVEELLERLTDEGRKLGVVTVKRRRTVELAFSVLPIERYFGVVVTTESTERAKPDPQPVLYALEQLGAAAEQSAFVGDSPFDVAAGKAAGVFTVAVGWGGIHPHERLRLAGPDAFVERPEELFDVL
jgi:pyrophosphatase PpaX